MNLSLKKRKEINVFTLLLLVALFCVMGSRAYDIYALKIASYASECLLIGYTVIYSGIKTVFINYKVLIVAFILMMNYLLSPWEPQYSDLLKFFGYLCCYEYGLYLARRYDYLDVNKIILFLFIFTPPVVVLLFDHTVVKNLFFSTPNSFVYLGVAMGLFYTLVNYRKKNVLWKAILIMAFYVLICTSLGVVVAGILSFMILNLKRTHLPYLLLGGIVFFVAVAYINLPLFIRFRDVFHLWTSMTASDWANLQDINFLELQQGAESVGDRGDTTSSIWRIAHWSNIFIQYVSHIWAIPFGLGAGISINKLGGAPHNDYLLILSEYGLVVFIMFITLIIKLFRYLKNEGILLFFILTMFLYHVTENLINIFPPNAILYFVVGWCMYKYRIQHNKCQINEGLVDK